MMIKNQVFSEMSAKRLPFRVSGGNRVEEKKAKRSLIRRKAKMH